MFEHPVRQQSRRGGRGRRPCCSLLAVLGVALAVAGATACAPPPTPTPACPARTEVPLEPVDPVHFSLPRALSADGDWLVASRVLGSDLTLSIRRTTADGASTPVGSLRYSQAASGTLLVSVPDDGSQVVFGTAGTAATEDAPQTTLQRWRAGTGTVTELAVPTVTSPPPGVPYPANAVALSADGRRVLWTQSFRAGPEPYVWHRVLVVTDAATDAIVSVATVDDGFFLGWTTGDGSAVLDGNRLIDTGTGAVTDLSGDVAAAQAAFPGPRLFTEGVSDDLRHLVLRRYDATVAPGVLTYLVWDRVQGTGRQALRVLTTAQVGQPLIQVNAVTPAGSLLVTRWSSPPNLGDVIESHPSGGVRTVVASATRLAPELSWTVSTTDGRTVVSSRQSIFGQQLVAHRCS